jgi:hypothetical protein
MATRQLIESNVEPSEGETLIRDIRALRSAIRAS